MLVNGSPTPCLLNSAQFHILLLLQFLMTFTKQSWLFLFYVLYPMDISTLLPEEKRKLLKPTR